MNTKEYMEELGQVMNEFPLGTKVICFNENNSHNEVGHVDAYLSTSDGTSIRVITLNRSIDGRTYQNTFTTHFSKFKKAEDSDIDCLPKDKNEQKKVMMEYTAKILKITRLQSGTTPMYGHCKKITSPYREAKDLQPSLYDFLIEAEIISVKHSNLKIKTSCFTTIGVRSTEEARKFEEVSYIKKRSKRFASLITICRMMDLRVGELIQFSYPEPETEPEPEYIGKYYNLIRCKNQPLTIEDFKNKSYPSKIDNTLEDTDVRLSVYKKVKINYLKEVWFRLQGKYRFLIDIKQKLFYRRRSVLEKVKLTVGIAGLVIFFIFSLNPTLLTEPGYRWIFIITTVISGLKEFF
ncbi:MAG: hypothetical protein OXH00_10755 [Candidatus Poribacteria bacterium]|nr:hypothetical protein [Candidatus Poribacteria bacterium]